MLTPFLVWTLWDAIFPLHCQAMISKLGDIYVKLTEYVKTWDSYFCRQIRTVSWKVMLIWMWWCLGCPTLSLKPLPWMNAELNWTSMTSSMRRNTFATQMTTFWQPLVACLLSGSTVGPSCQAANVFGRSRWNRSRTPRPSRILTRDVSGSVQDKSIISYGSWRFGFVSGSQRLNTWMQCAANDALQET